MEAVLSRLKGLSADELREEFTRADLKCGPITATTRAIFERKLARVLSGPESGATERDNTVAAGDSDSAASNADQARLVSCAAAAAAASSAPQAASEEVDFGYGMGLNPPEEEEISVKSRTPGSVSVEGSCSQPRTEPPSKPALVSPSFFYGVCPLWEDVLARNGKRDSTRHIVWSYYRFLLRGLSE